MSLRPLSSLAAIVFCAACGGTPEISSVRASSSLQPSGSRYAPANLIDGTTKSWCEGVSGAGIGQTVTLVLKRDATVRSLHIKNGYGDPKFYARNNRVRTIRLEGDGSGSATVNLKDTGSPQALSFPAVSGRNLTLTITAVYASGQDDDTCLDEISFTPLRETPPVAQVEQPAGGSCACVSARNDMYPEQCYVEQKCSSECSQAFPGKTCEQVGFACEGWHQGRGRVKVRCAP